MVATYSGPTMVEQPFTLAQDPNNNNIIIIVDLLSERAMPHDTLHAFVGTII